MKKSKPSLQDALRNDLQDKNPENQNTSTSSTKSNKKLIVEIPNSAHYQIDLMRLELRRGSIKELVLEAINDLFKKHNYPPIV